MDVKVAVFWSTKPGSAVDTFHNKQGGDRHVVVRIEGLAMTVSSSDTV